MRIFRVAFLGILAGTALGLATTANADGMRRGSVKDYERPLSWTGFYFGAHLGRGWADVDWTRVSDTSAWFDTSNGTKFSHDLSGSVGGGQVGYNLQSGPWVLGAELALSGTSLDGTSRSTVSVMDDDLKTEIRTLLAATARVGYASNWWLAYAKAGYAGGDVKFSASDSAGPPPAGATSFSKFANGYTLGAGLEYMFTPNMTFGVDYSFVSLSGDRHTFGDGAGATITLDRSRLDMHAVTARLNFLLK